MPAEVADDRNISLDGQTIVVGALTAASRFGFTLEVVSIRTSEPEVCILVELIIV